MDKEVITSSDIKTLLGTSSKLKAGEEIIGALQTGIARTQSGEIKVVKNIIKDRIDIESEPETVPIIGEGVTGEAIIEAFRKAKIKKESFSLKRSFFTALDKIISSANKIKMNFFRAIYRCDEFGRVYIECENKRHYLNKEKTHFITEDGNYGEIIFNKDGTVDLTYIDSEDAIYERGFMYFDYLYISPEAAKKGEELITAEEDRMMEEFQENSSLIDSYDIFADDQIYPLPTNSKVIDLEAYRRSIEEGPKR